MLKKLSANQVYSICAAAAVFALLLAFGINQLAQGGQKPAQGQQIAVSQSSTNSFVSNFNRSIGTSSSLQSSTSSQVSAQNINTSVASFTSSSSINSSFSSESQTNSLATQQPCDALECYKGKIGIQPILLKKIKSEGAGLGSSFYSGTITYTNAGNTPIPVKWKQTNNVDCGLEGIYQCRDITIEEMVENGGVISRKIRFNQQTQKEEIGNWQWSSLDGKTVLPMTLE